MGLPDSDKAGGGGAGLASPRVSPGSFSARQRDQTLEMLLSRERVLSLLYAKVCDFVFVFLRVSAAFSLSFALALRMGMGVD